MRRLWYSAMVLLLLMGISSIVFSTSNDLTPVYTFNRVTDFTATGLSMSDTTSPFHRIQNMMDFRLIDNENISRIYSTDEPKGTDHFPGTYKFEIDLRYNSVLLREFNEPFILGNFIYTLVQDDATMVIEGLVSGSLINANERGYKEFGLPDGTLVILLKCDAPDYAWGINFFLSTPNTTLATVVYVPNEDNTNYIDSNEIDDEYSYVESESLPTPSAGDIAAGTGIMALGIFLLNTMTNTSVFGSASFNGLFNPNATLANKLTPKPETSKIKVAGKSISLLSRILNNIGKFFKGLFEIIRDMLTDEGRSYASGRITDVLSDSELTDMSDNE